MRPALMADSRGERRVSAVELEALQSRLTEGHWEVEIGFGKGRYLLSQAAANPRRQYLGIEMAAKYYRLVYQRARRQILANITLLCGEAAYLATAMLPRQFARRVHVYFPDPWPKDRHSKRRLIDADALDLVLSMLKPGGELLFASDHPEYQQQVETLLRSHPSLAVRSVGEWPEGPRTNYEAKFVDQGQPILRLACDLISPVVFHPQSTSMEAG